MGEMKQLQELGGYLFYQLFQQFLKSIICAFVVLVQFHVLLVSHFSMHLHRIYLTGNKRTAEMEKVNASLAEELFSGCGVNNMVGLEEAAAVN